MARAGSSSLLLSVPEFPAAGRRRALPLWAGSGDAALLWQLRVRQRQAGETAPLVVLCAQAPDCARLEEELKWLAPEWAVHVLPDWETLPYEQFSPHQDLVSERLATLYAIGQGQADVVLAPVQTAMYRMAPPQYLAARTFFLKAGARLDVAQLRAQLAQAEYEAVTQVVRPGEFSVRGGLIDLYPTGSALPFRIDLFDETMESIKTFDPDTQRTLYPVPEIRLLPAREFALDEAGRACFRSRFREVFEGDPSRVPLYKSVSQGVAPAGIEYYLPLFFAQTATLFDHLPPASGIVLHGEVAAAMEQFWRDTESRYEFRKGERQHPVLAPAALFLRADELFVRLRDFACLTLPRAGGQDETCEGRLPPLAVERKAADPFAALRAFVSERQRKKKRVCLVAESAGRRQTLLETLQAHALEAAACASFAECLTQDAPLLITVAPLAAGFVLERAGVALVTEADLYEHGARARRTRERHRAQSMEGWLRDLSELKPGQLVVHNAHGIGRYLGLTYMNLGEGEAEFLHLQYADEASLYVPVAQLHVIARYAGADPESVALHRLGSGQWEKARRRAAQKAHDTAAELLALYAKRAARQGHAFQCEAAALEQFAAGFGFETTMDQQTAIDAVLEDLRAPRPMDRLVCGDVGFGKTEVALRAAFVAVADGKQVALLAPTTLLTEQHWRTFTDRFADFPVTVAELSRFRSAREQAQVLEAAAEGKVDILIGTHRLLQKDVRFARLGLVIIDEEHRFGVRQKENLKALRASVDVLTLTATPIPRTLGLALEGLREFSVIATAPQKRLAIKTFVQPWSRSLVREAVLREFRRGGQVYYLHNDVASIEHKREMLAELLPEARILVGHGQMAERELEQVMNDFTHQRANLLLCTTIIETGIDIPTANTILIDRADRFGLAQLHQLRGRVGRSHHQAYAYLFTDRDAKPTAQAQKRLEAIAAMEELGSGFYLAMHDLEIRGAGEILGEHQSGEIGQIGFSLYSEMLSRAVKALRKGETPRLEEPFEALTEIRLGEPALLPADYCPDVEERLTLYKRLADCDSREAIDALYEEFIDRFGLLPAPARTLLETHRLRLICERVQLAKVEATATRIRLEFAQNAPVDPAAVLVLIQQNPRTHKLETPTRLAQTGDFPDVPTRIQAIHTLLQQVLETHTLPQP